MIDRFTGDYRFLSNFHEAPLEYGGIVYRNSEGAYQAAKTDKQEDRLLIAKMVGKEAKQAGALVTMRPDWDAIKVRVMSEVVHAKFGQDEELRRRLVVTYPEVLIEGNWWHDTFWGVCRGEGKNWLGRILMAERAYWRNMERTQLVEVWLPEQVLHQ